MSAVRVRPHASLLITNARVPVWKADNYTCGDLLRRHGDPAAEQASGQANGGGVAPVWTCGRMDGTLSASLVDDREQLAELQRKE